ncbi:MAG: nuclear transport factor 2 family protein [Planctomycetota bacterium]
MKRGRIIAPAVIAAVVLVWLLWPAGDERQIRRMFDRLARTVSKDAGDGPFTLSGKHDGLRAIFTDDCEVAPGPPAHSMRGLGDVTTAYTAAFQYVKELTVSFRDVTVTVTGDTASVRTTVTATGPDIEGIEAREAAAELVRTGDGWRIKTIRAVPTLIRPGSEQKP